MHLPKLERRPELDALRGLFLVWMTLTHMPTRISDWVNQPFGFLSSAEGFVFLSALLVARIYRKQAEYDTNALRSKLWKRALKIYGIHLGMLLIAFTVVATLAFHTHREALTNLLNFYMTRPKTAIVGSVLLLYCPPLLDILPMYVLFLAATPLILTWAAKRGWRVPLGASFLLWCGAQFGLRDTLHNLMVRVTHLQIPLQETGAFNLLAWQSVWMAGLWLGARSAEGRNPLHRINRPIALAALAVCLFFLGVRHDWLGAQLSQEALAFSLDKWHIGPLRVLNLAAFTALFYWLRRFVFPVVQMEPFLTLGKASLEVFCTHIVFVFLALALLYNDVTELHGTVAILALAFTFVGLFLTASWLVRRRAQPPAPPPSGALLSKPSAITRIEARTLPHPPVAVPRACTDEKSA
jgi:hypothetical protein